MRISDWSSDVCSSDLADVAAKPMRLDRDAAVILQRGDDEMELDVGRGGAGGHRQEPARLGIGRRHQPRARPFPAQNRPDDIHAALERAPRSEEHTSELQSLMRISYAVFCLTTKKTKTKTN